MTCKTVSLVSQEEVALNLLLLQHCSRIQTRYLWSNLENSVGRRHRMTLPDVLFVDWIPCQRNCDLDCGAPRWQSQLLQS